MHAKMNDTLWYDGVDGHNLVCSPGNEKDKEFSFGCLLITRILPGIMMPFASIFILMAWWQLKFNRRLRKVQPADRNASKNKSKKESPDDNHGAILALVLGICALSGNLTFIVNGHGTSFASDTLRGTIGDSFFAIYQCAVWYVALIQIRGAKWFKGLVRLPAEGTTKSNGSFHLPSATMVLNAAQGKFGPLITLVLWVLLVTKTLSRGWFYFVGYTFTAIFGTRAFIAIATQRVSALRKIASMQNTVRGTIDDKKRRRGILRNKLFGLAIDLSIAFSLNVVLPSSLIFARSVFSSRQLVLHYSVMLGVVTFALCVLVLTMHFGFTKAKKRKIRISRLKSNGVTIKSTVDESCRSEVPANVQDVNMPYPAGKFEKKKTRVRLFSVASLSTART